MKNLPLCQLLCALGLLVTPAVLQAGTLSASIFNELSVPVAARVYLRDAHDRPLFAPHTLHYAHSNKFGSEFHFVAPHGAFSIQLPAGKYLIRIEHGKEYRALSETIFLPQAGSVTKAFHLQRWTDMAAQGWYSGDMHVHAMLQDLPTLMEAEDLNMALPITAWRLPGGLLQTDPQLNDCLAKADSDGALSVSDNRWLSCVNEELESWSSSLLVSHLGRATLPLRYPYAKFGQEAHERGAFTDSEKATALELPATAALGAVDFVGLANNHLWPSGCDLVHWGAWPSLLPGRYSFTCAGFALANFDIYYMLLQFGLPLRLSAGSAYGVHPVPLGWSRVYVRVPGQFLPAAWFKALKEGHSFVTTGPMLFLHANGLEPGDESYGRQFPLIVDVELEMLAEEPVSRAEIVTNGSSVPVQLTPDPGRPNTYRGHSHFTLQSSSWMAARYLSPKSRGVEVAHTSPIYFWREEEPLVPSTSQIRYLRTRIQNLIAQAAAEPGRMGAMTEAKIVLDTPARRKQTLQYFVKALEFYDRAMQNDRARSVR
ncbi:MAG TPA: CehA/McbA family metallohydrolase [Terriglobales bacterium]|nr:CehA/McbA family metallohydrolase [Terriglobales bacterium]